MADVIVVGAGIAGLGTALAMSQQGHRVTVVERDATTVPDSPDAAFEQWHRRGAPQVRHSHAFLARLRNLLRDRAPEVLEDLLDAGATELRFLDHPPPSLEDRSPYPGDEELVALACRRTTFEWVLRRDALGARRVTLVEGAITGLLADPAAEGWPHVTGVELADGGQLRADLVVDASGVRSALPDWLRAIGVRSVPQREQDTGIVYSSRFYRLRPEARPPSTRGWSLATSATSSTPSSSATTAPSRSPSPCTPTTGSCVCSFARYRSPPPPPSWPPPDRGSPRRWPSRSPTSR